MRSLPTLQHRSWIPREGAGGFAAVQPCSSPSGHSPLTTSGLLPGHFEGKPGILLHQEAPCPCQEHRWPGHASPAGWQWRLSASHCCMQLPHWVLHGQMLSRLQPSTVLSFAALCGGVGRLSPVLELSLRHWMAHKPQQRGLDGLGVPSQALPAAGWGCRRLPEVLAGAGLPAPRVSPCTPPSGLSELGQSGTLTLAEQYLPHLRLGVQPPLRSMQFSSSTPSR